jgi:hypothetical protein
LDDGDVTVTALETLVGPSATSSPASLSRGDDEPEEKASKLNRQGTALADWAAADCAK